MVKGVVVASPLYSYTLYNSADNHSGHPGVIQAGENAEDGNISD